MGFSIFSIAAWFLVNLTYIQAIIISAISFSFPILLTKLFHERIENIVEKILIQLEKHKKIKKIIIKFLK